MDIRWKNFSHSLITKIIVFIITMLCFTSAITVFIDVMRSNNEDLDIAFEKDYYLSKKYMRESTSLIETITTLIEMKSEKYILEGGTITEEEILRQKDSLFRVFRHDERNYYKHYDPRLSDEENYKKFEEVYADRISLIKDNLIAEELKSYNVALRKLAEYKGVYYYAGDGVNVFTNSPEAGKDFFKTYPNHFVIDKTEKGIYPVEVKENPYFYWIERNISTMEQADNALYIAFTDEFLNPRIEEWRSSKESITYGLYQIMGFIAGLIAAFISLIIIIGRRFFGDKEVQLNFADKLYNDFNIIICLALIGSWFGAVNFIFIKNITTQAIFPITFLIGTFGLILVLSLVKHIKDRTLIKHTFIYVIFSKIIKFIKEIYDSGSVGIKIALLVIGYPIIVAVTFFIFPITIGVGVWLAIKKVKEYEAIKDGVKKVKEGDLRHSISIAGDGEFSKLAADINSITDGLKKAVDRELKSERLKTELITNVSHDIRTPLTSIITYVDLLKNEKDPTRSSEYIQIIDQKSQRLKILTQDLFEAAKASSGNIPVNYEKIDIVALINQGLGELDDKIKERRLEFRLNHMSDKVYVKADGKLLWRAIENLLSNIFKYALEGSRVYIDISEADTEATVVIKNISAYELNIASAELMERFVRGDESRSSQGSGLGLSIAKSLIEIQKGSFIIEIDGDLFKAIIRIGK